VVGPQGARAPEHCRQDGAAYRFDWGAEGLDVLAAQCTVIVIVDVLRFTTAVCCALESGVVVLPYRWNDDGAPAYAVANDAQLAGRREEGALSLSPTDLLTAPSDTRLVLPSPNGSTLAFMARELGVQHVLAGCIRNAGATARAARNLSGGGAIGVIAAGERWYHEGAPLRPAVEDMLGAGAILAALDPAASISEPRCSPEAAAARAAFVAARPLVYDALAGSVSGQELVARGWEDDVATAAAHDVSDIACRLVANEFRRL
jgi:2-phosphosulfolactate phosphatase